ncbi:MAG: tungstate ABC transporter substrate-binding protein WtpA [Methanomassiliicoccales archaeon]
MRRILALGVAMVFVSMALMGCLGDDTERLYVYHAGSLTIPFDELGQRFEEDHPGVDVRREAAGSVATVRKVTDQGKEPDVVGLADYSLIPDMMYEEYADWTVQFAKNRMTLAYTDQSAYKDEINQTNWYQVLLREDVKFGFSNPNDDPCGYRSQMVTLLAEDHYQNDSIYDDLIERHTAIRADGYNITVPSSNDLDVDTSKIMVRSAEVDLMSALEAGEIDYLFIYQSVASQHHGVSYLNLPEAIDLSSIDYADEYGKVTLTRASGDTSTGKPIVYGVTIPSTSKNHDLAVEFLELLLGPEGQGVMEDMGQPPIVPPTTDNIDAMPSPLQSLVEER